MSKRRTGRGRETDRALKVCPAVRTEWKAIIVEEAGERTIGRHVPMAHTTVKGEHQLTTYVARLEIAECARILAANPDGLPLLAVILITAQAIVMNRRAGFPYPLWNISPRESGRHRGE